MKTIEQFEAWVHSLLSRPSPAAEAPTLNRTVIDPLSIPTFKREGGLVAPSSQNTAA